MVCKSCGFQLSDDSTFCPQCGERLKSIEKRRVVDYVTEECNKNVCASCGAPMSAKLSFCGRCGKPRAQGAKAQRIPKCVRCAEPLLRSARFCIMCRLEYVPSKEGYVEIPTLPHCAKCGEMAEEGLAFCTKCGESLRVEERPAELCLPICPNCKTPYDSESAFCPGCGERNTNPKKPIVHGDLLTCPGCGEEKMPATRKVCWKCGMAWELSPWFCTSCGTENVHLTAHCHKCGANR